MKKSQYTLSILSLIVGVITGSAATYSLLMSVTPSAEQASATKLSAAYSIVSPINGEPPSPDVVSDRAHADFAMSFINAAPSYDAMETSDSKDFLRRVAKDSLKLGAIDKIRQSDLKASAEAAAACLDQAGQTNVKVSACLQSKTPGTSRVAYTQ
ncbi:hypothetical protein [Xanthomonas arboricola]|uniref:hypothetical protein n=1 Tax=Xanthomonas arboricola TaxID=56448 RepID=UPI0023BA1494|nr:hypothetical protein [Xanthomonas arboricola]